MKLYTLFTAMVLCASVPAFSAGDYKLGPEDVLTVSVYGHEDLNREVVVLNDGRFSYPIVGRVEATGKTTYEVASAIATGLEKELNDPSVTVSVKQPAVRRVYAGGLVNKAGSFDLKPDWRVSHLLAESGGISGKPELAKATLVRGGDYLPLDLQGIMAGEDRSLDIELKPGDLLQVQPDTNLVHIVGQAKTPGDYQVKSKLGVLEAVSMAGGVTENAALSKAQLLRGGEIIKVDLYAMLARGETSGNIEVKAGDTLVIPANEARVAILGGVGQPGYYDLPDGKDVMLADAIGMAKGSNKRAKTSKVALIRVVDGKQVVSSIDLSRFLKKGDLTQNPKLASGDVIYVTDGSPFEPASILSALTSLANPLIYSFVR